MLQKTEAQNCLHCGSETKDGESFCCSGCATVYSYLQSSGLGHFYQLKKEGRIFSRPQKSSTSSDFQYLESIKQDELEFFVSGVHCSGCVWLIEKLPEILPGIQSARFDMANSIARIKTNGNLSWAKVADAFQKIGYNVRPLDQKQSKSEYQAERKIQLKRLAVAAFSTGNIMLLAVAIYAGAEGITNSIFNWISFALATPVVFYSAYPFYQNILIALRHKRFSIDLPIVAAIWAAYGVSIQSLFSDGKNVYFDSLSMLIFLLSSSRFVLSALLSQQQKEKHLLTFLNSDKYKNLKVGDTVTLEAGETIPADGILKTNKAALNLAMLSGESEPVLSLLGDRLYAGSIAETNLSFTVDRLGSDTRIGSILNKVDTMAKERSPYQLWSEKIAKHFISVVGVLSLVLIAYFSFTNPFEGWRRALALIIVTCPCVLAFAIPLTGVILLRAGVKRGIFVKNIETLEKIISCRDVFFDKTGTITSGQFTVESFLTTNISRELIFSAVYSMEKNSYHPVAKSIVRYIVDSGINYEEYKDIAIKDLGNGLGSIIDNEQWRIQAAPISSNDGKNLLHIYRNEQLVGRVTLSDKIISGSKKIIYEIENDFKIHLLSGDNRKNVEEISHQLGIENYYFNQSPENKADLIKKYPNSMMVGDGANDAIAFQAANVGVAVYGAMDLSLRNADVYLTKPGLMGLKDLIGIANLYNFVIRRNLWITLSYNFIGGTLAILGFMTPLWAAVLMPLSALSVFLYTNYSCQSLSSGVE